MYAHRAKWVGCDRGAVGAIQRMAKRSVSREASHGLFGLGVDVVAMMSGTSAGSRRRVSNRNDANMARPMNPRFGAVAAATTFLTGRRI